MAQREQHGNKEKKKPKSDKNKTKSATSPHMAFADIRNNQKAAPAGKK